MNKATTIKPSGVSDRTNVSALNMSNDTLWSDTTATWSDNTVMWSIGQFNNNAIAPKMSIKSIKP